MGLKAGFNQCAVLNIRGDDSQVQHFLMNQDDSRREVFIIGFESGFVQVFSIRDMNVPDVIPYWKKNSFNPKRTANVILNEQKLNHIQIFDFLNSSSEGEDIQFSANFPAFKSPLSFIHEVKLLDLQLAIGSVKDIALLKFFSMKGDCLISLNLHFPLPLHFSLQLNQKELYLQRL